MNWLGFRCARDMPGLKAEPGIDRKE